MRFAKTTAAVAAAALSLTLATPALALPPTGEAKVDTEGTSVKLLNGNTYSKPDNCTIRFELSGWTPGMKFSAKVDKGQWAGGDQGVQGQGVWSEGIVEANGKATGSMDLCDKNVPEGKHYLRFVGNDGTKGFSTRGDSDFTVIAEKKDEKKPGNDDKKPGDNDKKPGDNNKGDAGSAGGGGMIAIIAIVLALLGAVGAALSGAIPGLPRP
ncbi:hypothetical protein C1Y63_09305 [Corynebacterium sp. 13CS0277]|uniref:hypothetical protein n=1 Tax=Corynebacterium sp. 13CS0277 TaxID=2071994 RepID=UPI000D0457F4|nr:hypothetical protein [Corynebacterium sp. 13CS0277]PRQ10827.1 hypothetical protein C1Y63_09305 [Corynebacterium sp. 13CS0277]